MLEKAGDVISGVTKVYFLKNGKQMVTRFPKGRTITLNPDTWQEAREMFEKGITKENPKLKFIWDKYGYPVINEKNQYETNCLMLAYLTFKVFNCSHLPKEKEEKTI
jgi:hypothetical protein